MSGHHGRIAPFGLNSSEKHIPTLTARHQVDKHIDDMGKVVAVVGVQTQEYWFKQPREEAVEKLALLPLGMIQQGSSG